MLEIEFRGKCVKTGIWVYGTPIETGVSGMYLIWTKTKSKRDPEGMTIKDKVYFTEVTPVTVGQYTGLKDKNKRKVYRGDVLKKEDCWDYYVEYRGGAWVAIACNSAQRANNHSWPLTQDKLKEWVIINNIHDTPELLKEV